VRALIEAIVVELMAADAFRLPRAATCALLFAVSGLAGDWLTFGHDPQRSGWAIEEKALNPENVSTLRLLWKAKVNNQFYSLSALTAPVVMTRVPTPKALRSIVYVAGISGTVFALDAQSGEELWTRTLRSMVVPRKGGFQGTFLCPNGITATPVIDEKTGMLYVTAPDGALYGLDLGTGRIQYGPVPFVAPFAKSWSLNLYEGSVYTTVSLGCGGGRAGVYAADIQHPSQPAVREVLTSNGFRAGIWGRGGAVIGENGKLYGGTSDGESDPGHGDYSNTVVAVSLRDLSLADYFLPTNWRYLKDKDLDMASGSPVWFSWNHRSLIAHGSKEGVVRVLDADSLGGRDHQTPLYTLPRLGNDLQECCLGIGIWGGLSSSRDDQGETWVYVPMGGPPAAHGPKFPISNGDTAHGSIMAFRVESSLGTTNPVLEPAWISGDFDLPDPVVIANGVVFALSNGENANQRGGDESRRFLNTRPAVLKALEAKTGKELFNSGTTMTSWVHFSGIAVADGRIYAVDHDSNVYCFGLEGVPASTLTSQTSPRTSAPGRHAAAGEGLLGTSWVERAQNQNEFLNTWIRRAALCAAPAVMAAILGLWVGMHKAPRPSVFARLSHESRSTNHGSS
jgi:outer membrane protein assembly factor BamB